MRAGVMDDLEQLAETAEERGDYEEAFALWSRLARQARHPEFYCRAGLAAQELARWADAENSYLTALRLDDTSTSAIECMGQLFLSRLDGSQAQNFRSAIEWLTRALNFEKNARLLNFLGNAYTGVGEKQAARRVFREALNLDPRYEEAAYSLAMLEKRNAPETAIELLRIAIEIDPEYFSAHQQLGVLLQQLGDVVRAEYEFRRSLELIPDDYWSSLYLANALAVQGDTIGAEQQFRVALSLRPGDEDGKRFFATFLESQGRNDEAHALTNGSTT